MKPNITSYSRPALAGLLVLLSTTILAQPTVRTLPGEQMRADLHGSSITKLAPGEWQLKIRVQDDNNDPSLPAAFRRWWHVEVADLTADGGNAEAASTVHVELLNAGYRTVVLPVISVDDGATYARLSPESTPVVEDGVHRFTMTVPPGVTSFRLAKYFPYTATHHRQWHARTIADPRVSVDVLGYSVEGRAILVYTITDTTVPPDGKRGVWVHGGVHPAENTAYFMVDGFTNWLLGDDPQAGALRRATIVNLVAMPNPDGVWHGNYRTNVRSVNLEREYAPPWDSQVPEARAIRRRIEQIMGTAEAPGANPIEVLLNLHAAHGGGGPFHFVHEPGWPDGAVKDSVRAMEDRWIAAFRARSPFVATGRDQRSTLEDRAYIEAMMHDRYSIHPQWPEVMAITIEGTYQAGPTEGVAGTDEDYREVGRAMGQALADYLGL